METVLEHGGPELLGALEPLWRELNALHARLSPHFAARYRAKRFADREAALLGKAATGQLSVTLAVNAGRAVGYCVVTARADEGEIVSATVEHRGVTLRSPEVGRAQIPRDHRFFCRR